MESKYILACSQYLNLANKELPNDQSDAYYNCALINGIISEAGPTKDSLLAKLSTSDKAAANPHQELLEKFYRSELLVDEDYAKSNFKGCLSSHQEKKDRDGFTP